MGEILGEISSSTSLLSSTYYVSLDLLEHCALARSWADKPPTAVLTEYRQSTCDNSLWPSCSSKNYHKLPETLKPVFLPAATAIYSYCFQVEAPPA